ncbi:MAG: SpoIID/LytB domain-containing protein [Ignavibacteria bacterium]|jgi:stage II sporulation protein D
MLLTNCSSSERFTSEEKFLIEEFKPATNNIRVLLDEKPSSINLIIRNKVALLNENKKIAEINQGNNINFSITSNLLSVKIGRKNFYGKYFQLTPIDGQVIAYNNKSFRGSLRIVDFGKFIDVINFVDLENYLKGVIATEMPLGIGMENFEALKAFTISARTYAISKRGEGNILFDIFSDTRDQVYGGHTAEELITSKAVEQTSNMILFYDGEPARVYYHSTCGGVTENVENVFPMSHTPYLTSVTDGNDPYCKISPRFSWEEEFTEKEIISRLYRAGSINTNNNTLTDIKINSYFESGRVNDLEINLNGINGSKAVHIYGNEIRSVLIIPDRNIPLWSTMFTMERKSNGNIIFKGKGFGHGVGLCQWGAIGQSRSGIGYTQILEHYYPGTEIGLIND